MPKQEKNCCLFNKCVCVLSCVWLTAMPWTAASQSPLSKGSIFLVRILEWVGMPSSRGSSQSRDRTHVSCTFWIAGGFNSTWTIEEAPISVICFFFFLKVALLRLVQFFKLIKVSLLLFLCFYYLPLKEKPVYVFYTIPTQYLRNLIDKTGLVYINIHNQYNAKQSQDNHLSENFSSLHVFYIQLSFPISKLEI